jgi:hypothetical protein
VREKTATRQLTFSLTEEEYAYVKSKGRGYLRHLVQRAMCEAQAKSVFCHADEPAENMRWGVAATAALKKPWWRLW